jgi:hypothetical protein
MQIISENSKESSQENHQFKQAVEIYKAVEDILTNLIHKMFESMIIKKFMKFFKEGTSESFLDLEKYGIFFNCQEDMIDSKDDQEIFLEMRMLFVRSIIQDTLK